MLTDYLDHNDAKGRDARLRLEVNRAERARMRELQTERDLGAVTLFMDRLAIQRRLYEARLYYGLAS